MILSPILLHVDLSSLSHTNLRTQQAWAFQTNRNVMYVDALDQVDSDSNTYCMVNTCKYERCSQAQVPRWDRRGRKRWLPRSSRNVLRNMRIDHFTILI